MGKKIGKNIAPENKNTSHIPKSQQNLLRINFPNFPNCIEVEDVCFQPIQKPSGSFRSKKVFFRKTLCLWNKGRMYTCPQWAIDAIYDTLPRERP